MKKYILTIITVVLSVAFAFAQQENKPYVILKSGEKINYENVYITITKNFVCTDAKGKETSYKAKEIESAVEGSTEKIKRQVVLMKFKFKGLKSNGTVIEGAKIYTVVAKNGDNMIVSKIETSMGSFGYSNPSANKTYYLVTGTSVKNVEGASMFKDTEIVPELISLFGSCGKISALLEEYDAEHGKILKVDKLYSDIEKEYLENCLE